MKEQVLNLNDKQCEAVEHQGGPLLVLAGPGTGKTGVLVGRIAHLVADQDISPGRILALTFSRRAAEEMQSRVKTGCRKPPLSRHAPSTPSPSR